MKIRKKLTALLLTCVMVITLCPMAFAPIEGLHRSDDIQGEVPDASTLKVTTIAPCVQKLIQARENASRGVIDNSFFAADFSGIQKKAEALVQGEAYDPSDVENRFFVRSLCDFFVGSDEKEVAASYEALVREYADKLKNGEKPDITQLQTQFSLWRGDDHRTGA